MASEPPATIELRMRSVVSTPYRASPGAPQDREPSPPRPVREVEAALRAIPSLAKLERTGTTFVLSAKGDERTLRVELGSPDAVALPGIALSGDERLAFHVAHALVPLFGAVELRVGSDYADVVDGSESVEVLLERHQEDLRKRAAALLSLFEDFQSKVIAPVTKAVEGAAARRAAKNRLELKQLLVLIAVCLAGIGGIWFFGTWLPRQPVAGECAENKDCRSEECLPRDVVRSLSIGGVTLPGPMPTNKAGVCTEACVTDGDCPSSMRCEEVEQRTGFAGMSPDLMPGARVHRCAPRAWQSDAMEGQGGVNDPRAE